MNKNEEYVVDIIDNGFQGEGIAKIDGMTVFIPNVIKNEKNINPKYRNKHRRECISRVIIT